MKYQLRFLRKSAFPGASIVKKITKIHFEFIDVCEDKVEGINRASIDLPVSRMMRISMGEQPASKVYGDLEISYRRV